MVAVGSSSRSRTSRAALGITLEWEKTVDPFGGALPKIGIFFHAQAAGETTIRDAVLERCRRSGAFAAVGYRVGTEPVWPVVKRVEPSRVWWRDPDAWLGATTGELIELWNIAAPVIEAARAARGVE